MRKLFVLLLALLFVACSKSHTPTDAEFVARVTECDYSGNLMHISFDDTAISLDSLFATGPESIYEIAFFRDLRELHDKYGACFSLYFYSDKLANVTDNYKTEFQQAKNWLRFNFHTFNDKKYGRKSIAHDYDNGIRRLLTMVGDDRGCLDGQIRGNYWEMSESNANYIKSSSLHPSFILCGKDPFSPSKANNYLTPTQQTLLFNNGIYFDIDNGLIFIQTCARLDTDDYCQRSMQLISRNLKWQKHCEVLNHEWAFSKERMDTVLSWATTRMHFRFGFFADIYTLR